MEMIKFSSFFLVVATVLVLMAVTTASGCNVDKVCVKTISTSGRFGKNAETDGPVYIQAKNGGNRWPFFATLYSSTGFQRSNTPCFDMFNSFSAVDEVIVKVGNDGWWPDYIRFCPENRNTYYHCQWKGQCGRPDDCLIQNRDATVSCSRSTGNGCP